MTDIYLTDSILLREEGDREFFVGPRRLEVQASAARFPVGDVSDEEDDGIATVRDLDTGALLEVEFVDVTELTFGGPGGTETGLYVGLDVELPSGLERFYVVRLEGPELPAVIAGESVEAYVARVGIVGDRQLVDVPGSGFEDGDTIFFDDVADLDFQGQGLTIGQAARVALLYEAALDRNGAIDAGGLNFWIDGREAGLSEVQVAEEFLDNPEFRAAFGEAVDPAAPGYLGNRALVEQLYRNVLEREGDAPGINFWTGLLDDGVSRGAVLIEFATVPENTVNSQFVFDDLVEVEEGVWAI